VRVADPSVDPAKTVRIFVMCRQHGDEPAPTEAALRLLHEAAHGHDPALLRDLKQVTLYLVPMVNPDGADAMTRRSGVGADLNRDWGVFSQPETRAVARAAHLIRPQIILDFHNWDGDDLYNANCIEAPRSEETPLFRADHALQHAISQRLAASGYQVYLTAYGPEIDQRLAHRYFTNQGALSLLVETHSGDPRDVADFQRRQGFYEAIIHGLTHQYGQSGAQYREALARAEPVWNAPAREASLFPASDPSPSRPASRAAPPAGQELRWLWAICLYALAVWLGCLCRPRPDATPDNESARARRPLFVPASAAPSTGRRGMRRYRC
jgi:hypothetical protein